MERFAVLPAFLAIAIPGYAQERESSMSVSMRDVVLIVQTRLGLSTLSPCAARTASFWVYNLCPVALKLVEERAIYIR